MMELDGDEPTAKNRSGCFWSLLAVAWLLLKWGFIGVASIAGMLKLWSVLDPPKPLLISRETTLITEPLAADGLPDYARFVLDRQREGVTPENNGAIPFWKAMGPSIIDSEFREILFEEIGMPIPSEEGSLKKLSGDETRLRVGEWLNKEWDEEDRGKWKLMELADEWIADARRHPWGDVTPTPLAEWVEENQSPLDLLVEAAHKSCFYSPPPNLLTDPPDPFLMALMFALAEARDACRGLGLRATYQIEKRDYEGAWDDLEASFLVSDHVARGVFLVSQIAGIACRKTAYEALNVLLQEADDLVLVQSILTHLLDQPEPFFLPDSLEFGDSMTLMDTCVRAISPSRQSMEEYALGTDRIDRIDVNLMLRYVLSWQNRMINIAHKENRSERYRQMLEFEEDWYLLDENANSPGISIIMSAFSRKEAGRNFGKVFVLLAMSDPMPAIKAEDRSVDELRLARTAAALAVWRLEQGGFPDRLEQLVPDLLPELPVDASWDKPFRYERRGNGYLLYAIGTDGEDNGGDNRDGTIIDGEWILDKESEAVPDGVDLVIRLPIPELRLPAPPTQR